AINMNDLDDENDLFYDAGKAENGIVVTIGKSVTKIPAYIFYPDSNSTNSNTHSPNLSFVKFENASVCQTIGARSFYKCDNLEKITIPNSVTRIDECAFYYCSIEEAVFENPIGWYRGGKALDPDYVSNPTEVASEFRTFIKGANVLTRE
ncbi:MAG: leucine-rich repeat protein, partial [Clostridia bacterium]|nr:leucine-rich repeat protein [Clostridia bacterium]